MHAFECAVPKMSPAKEKIATIQLPEKLNSAAAPKILKDVKAQQGNAIRLNGSGVTMIGALCAQVLIAARQSWQEAGQDFEVTNLSNDMYASLEIFGLAAEQIGAGELTHGA